MACGANAINPAHSLAGSFARKRAKNSASGDQGKAMPAGSAFNLSHLFERT